MYAAARTSRISSVAYAVEESASEEKTASAVFFVNRSCAKRAVLIGLPSSRRFRDAIVYALSRTAQSRAKNATAWLTNRPTVATHATRGARYFSIRTNRSGIVLAVY